MTIALDSPLSLPCGAVLKNRLAKAAMTEGLSDAMGRPGKALQQLYSKWAHGGAGLLLSGNILVDRYHLERPGNVVIDTEPDVAMQKALASLAQAATQNGAHFWAQLSHAGRQTMSAVNPHPKAPSPVAVDLPGKLFGEPSELSQEEIGALVRRFAVAAAAVQGAGFTGLQIHAAHGYLVSQFLSPRSNLRGDRYGGSLENRARFLLEIVAAVRKAVGAAFPVSVKLNSADFQRGGFNFDESLQVAQWLQDAGIDLLEVSGGTYEQPTLMGLEGRETPERQRHVAASTREREAYFVDFAAEMHRLLDIPLMVTGGFRSRIAMQQALESGAADVIGLGRPLCLAVDGPAQLLNGGPELPRLEDTLKLYPGWLGFLRRFKTLRDVEGIGAQYWYYAQLYRWGDTGQAQPGLHPFKAIIEVDKRQKRWLAEARASGFRVDAGNRAA